METICSNCGFACRAVDDAEEIERLRSATAVTMGVGDGAGKLFVHGDYESIKVVQDKFIELGRLRGIAAGHECCIDKLIEENKRLTGLTERATTAGEVMGSLNENLVEEVKRLNAALAEVNRHNAGLHDQLNKLADERDGLLREKTGFGWAFGVYLFMVGLSFVAGLAYHAWLIPWLYGS